jgi:molybdopterin/thiamine biosynthesis adenylyltransferase
MDRQDWYDRRDDRTIRYGARRLDHARLIALSASPEYLHRFDGQVAALVAANLFSRMTPSVALCFPDVKLHAMLPWAGHSLHEVALAQMRAADPYGAFAVRERLPNDFDFHLGSGEADNIVHGTGWNAYVGPGPSPLPENGDLNCIGASLAVILGASQVFINGFDARFDPYSCNALSWRNEAIWDAPACQQSPSLGNILVAGVGSVGTAVLYFLTLATRKFSATLIDMDVVKIHNLDRSPIFTEADLRCPKVESTRDYLIGVGVADICIDNKPLHESRLWNERQAGQTDLVIAAANEQKVRYYIEAGYSPIQLYGTTGRNWQAAMIRHQPFGKACSLCLFPADQEPAPTACATAPDTGTTSDTEDKTDAALPFLSFVAGLMTAAETLKLGLPGYPFCADRVILNTRPAPLLVPAPLVHRNSCFCETRNSSLHKLMLAGTRYFAPRVDETAPEASQLRTMK